MCQNINKYFDRFKADKEANDNGEDDEDSSFEFDSSDNCEEDEPTQNGLADHLSSARKNKLRSIYGYRASNYILYCNKKDSGLVRSPCEKDHDHAKDLVQKIGDENGLHHDDSD